MKPNFLRGVPQLLWTFVGMAYGLIVFGFQLTSSWHRQDTHADIAFLAMYLLAAPIVLGIPLKLLSRPLTAQELKLFTDELLDYEPLRSKYLALLSEHLSQSASISLYRAWCLMQRMTKDWRPLDRQTRRNDLAKIRDKVLADAQKERGQTAK